ncbi:MAG: hypothetical protein WAN11_27265 [Syntrophobacteraceae bacterium]
MDGQHSDTIQTSERMAAGTSFIEGLVGLAAVALAIIGLAHIYPWLLASISTIALGAAFVFESGAIGARFSALAQDTQGSETASSKWSGITAGFLAGCAGIALGILALLGVEQTVLIPVATIVFGAALIMDSGIRVRLSAMESERFSLQGVGREVAREAASASSGIQVLFGLGGITLGILAVIGISPQTLSLVALLGVGAAVLVVGSLVGGRMMSIYRR